MRHIPDLSVTEILKLEHGVYSDNVLCILISVKRSFCFYLDIQDNGVSRTLSKRIEDLGLVSCSIIILPPTMHKKSGNQRVVGWFSWCERSDAIPTLAHPNHVEFDNVDKLNSVKVLQCNAISVSILIL